MKFCFSTFSKVLLQCKTPSTTQKELISLLFSIIDEHFDTRFPNEGMISNCVRGIKNISPDIIIQAKTCNPDTVLKLYQEKIVPHLDENKKSNLILAMKDLIAQDYDIKNETKVELISKQTKESLLKTDIDDLDRFLVGLYLYTLICTENRNTKQYAETITQNYISSFNETSSDLQVENDEKTQKKQDEKPHFDEYQIDEQIEEEARLFCIEFEEKLHMLPLCEMASSLNPKHKHFTPIINAYNQKKKIVQKAILLSKGLIPYEKCSMKQLNHCIDLFEKDIKDHCFFKKSFLYDGAKYFHRALERYPNYQPEQMDPIIFTRKSTILGQTEIQSNLEQYLNFLLDSESSTDPEKAIPPFDTIWSYFNLSTCKEQTCVFWVNRFIVSSCRALHRFDINETYDDIGRNKDVVNENDITTMEELYYYALFLLYMFYGNEKEEK